MRIPNPTYIPNNATSISFATPKVIIFMNNRKIIVPARTANETAMPATTFSVVCLGIGYRLKKRANTVASAERLLASDSGARSK